MTTPLLILPLRKNRDLLHARSLARHIAGLLGFDATGQACVAAAAFEVGAVALRAAGPTALHFQLAAGKFQVFPEQPADAPLRLEQALPHAETPLAPEDLAWVVRQLAANAVTDVLEELQRQNQELLRTVAELRACQARLTQPAATPGQTSAA